MICRSAPVAVKPSMIKVPVGLYLLVAALVCMGILTENPLLTFASLVSLPLFAKLTWFRGEPPILFFAVAFQWLQVSAAVFQANLQGRVMGSYPDPPVMVQAFWLSLAGLFVLAIGMRLIAGRRPGGSAIDLMGVDPRQFSLRKVWWVYLVLFVLANVLAVYLWSLPSLRSIALALFSLRWVAYFSLVYLAMVAGKGFRQPVLLAATLMELVIGFAGYFSGFKQALLVFMLALLSSKVRIINRDLVPIGAIVAFTLFLGVIWTAIKPEYRTFLNQGTGQQVVSISLFDSFLKATDLVMELEWTDFNSAAERMLSRIAYIEMFARVIDRVPQSLSHEDGALWMGAVEHITMPRLFFPGKAVLPSDSDMTMKYTGMNMASGGQGTSISMGYMAESYIDFGAYVMFVPIFLLGLLWGAVYRYFLTKTSVVFLGYGFATIVLLGASQFEIHSVKLLGGVLTNFLVLALFNHFFLQRFAQRLLHR